MSMHAVLTELPTRSVVPRFPPLTEAAQLHTIRGRLLKKEAEDFCSLYLCTMLPGVR